MRAALEHLAGDLGGAAGPGRRVAVLGEMKELGPDAASYHREIGSRARSLGVGPIVGVGELGRDYAPDEWAPGRRSGRRACRRRARGGGRGAGQGLAVGRAGAPHRRAGRAAGDRRQPLDAHRGAGKRGRIGGHRPRRGADRGDGGDADHDLPRPEVHRVPAREGVRAADPRGGPAGAPREGGHPDDGRADPVPGDRDPLSRPLRARHAEPRGARRRARRRGAGVRRRLDQGHPAPLAGPVGALQAAGADRPRGRALVRRHRGGRARPGAALAHLRHRARRRPGPLPGVRLPGDRGRLERRQPHRRARRPRRGLVRDRPAGLHGDHDHDRPGGAGAALGLLRRRLDRLPVVQRLPGVDLHGGYRIARAGGGDRRAGGDDSDRAAADHPRRHLRDRGAVGRDPGVHVQDVPPPGAADGAGPPPLRDARVVGDEDHAALLDRRRGVRGDRLRAVPELAGLRLSRGPSRAAPREPRGSCAGRRRPCRRAPAGPS